MYFTIPIVFILTKNSQFSYDKAEGSIKNKYTTFSLYFKEFNVILNKAVYVKINFKLKCHALVPGATEQLRASGHGPR